MQLPTTNIWDKIKYWDWDFSDLLEWFNETAGFHVQEHGWIAWVAITIVVVIILLNLDATRHATSLIISTIYRQTVGAVINGVFILAAALLLWLKNQVFARSRHISRSVSGLFKSGDRDDQ